MKQAWELLPGSRPTKRGARTGRTPRFPTHYRRGRAPAATRSRGSFVCHSQGHPLSTCGDWDQLRNLSGERGKASADPYLEADPVGSELLR